ncbi:MAG: lysophospholipid acyltransferase family protein [Kiloniellales bacterium]|nr:lysophospholipid acyltransferase family protein [Kiloniellales bacterium]
MIFLRSLIFNIFFWLWTAGFLILCLPFLLARPIVIYWIGHIWARVSLWALRWICGLGHEIRGREHLPNGPFIAACKHQSAWDTLILALLARQPAVVLKRELLRIPIFGWFLARAAMVPIDRSAGMSALKSMLSEAKDRAAEGRAIVIYPEGTRTAPGEKRPYHPGVFALYKDLNLPLIPMALNSGLFWGRKSFLKKPGKILIEILPALANGLPRKEFQKQLEEQIEEATARLVAEAKRDNPKLFQP